MIALARGCSLSASTAEASVNNRCSSTPATARSVTSCSPAVSVPVLSNNTTSTRRIPSSARRSLIRMPDEAATLVDTAIVSGMARPRAWGHAITSTVTVRSTALAGSPSAIQTTKVSNPDPIAA